MMNLKTDQDQERLWAMEEVADSRLPTEVAIITIIGEEEEAAPLKAAKEGAEATQEASTITSTTEEVAAALVPYQTITTEEEELEVMIRPIFLI